MNIRSALVALLVALTVIFAIALPASGSRVHGSLTRPTVTTTKTVTTTAPGPTTTVTQTVPGPTTTVTQTVPGPTTTVTQTVPGPTTTVTAPGPTVTETVTANPSQTPTDSQTPTQTPTTTTPTPTPTPTTTTTAPASGKVLLKHGWDIPSPSFVKANIATMDTMPFDGTTITIPGYDSKIHTQTPVSVSQLSSVLAPLAGLNAKKLTHNYLIVYAAPAGDPFGDWTTPVTNFGNLATAASAVGVEGIFFDSEEYFGSLYDYPNDCPGHTLAECQAQYKLRGQQIRTAVLNAWPTAKIMSTYGAWVSDPATSTELNKYFPYNDVSASNELMGPEAQGLALTDGGEIYSPRTTDQFNHLTAWERTESPGTLTGVAVYDYASNGVPMDVNIFGSTIKNALASDSSIVWVYTERYDWWGTGWPSTRVPQNWIDSVTAARS